MAAAAVAALRPGQEIEGIALALQRLNAVDAAIKGALEHGLS